MFDHWLSYSLIDFIPIEVDVYIGLFSRANISLWPWTIILFLLGIALVVLVIKKKARYACCLLGVAWFFCAYQFHIKLLNELSWIGSYFAAIFILQGLLLILVSVLVPSSKDTSHVQTGLGLFIILCSMSLFLIIPLFTNRPWTSVEVFSIAPNPTSVMTAGAMLALNIRRWWLYCIPIAWCALSLAVAIAVNGA